MTVRVQQIYADNPGSMSEAVYVVPPGLDLDLNSVRARVSAAGASASCIIVCELLTSDNRILAQSPVDQTLTVGDTGALTWAPFLARGGAGASTVLPALQLFDLTLSADTASVDTTGVDISGGVVLEIWSISRTDQAVAGPNLAIRFNGDSGNNYDYDWVRNVAGAVGPVDTHPSTAGQAAQTGSTAPAAYFAVNRVTVPGYDVVSAFNKIGEFTGYTPDSSTGGPPGIRVYTGGLLWRNTARITSISWAANPGFVLLAGSRFMVLRR